MAAYQAPLSLGFSRQEHWSGLPFPSPMHESEKWKWSHSVVSDSLRPHGLQPIRLLHPWDFPGKSTEVGCQFLLHFITETQANINVLYSFLGPQTIFCLMNEEWKWSESEVTQSCPTLCDPTDRSLPGFSVHGIFQARVLEWVAISFSGGSSWPRDQTRVSHIVGRCFYRLSHQGSYLHFLWHSLSDRKSPRFKLPS